MAAGHLRPRTPDEQRERYVCEMEFVQMLANVQYLQHLARQGYLDQPAFVGYLAYLRYWRRREYAARLVFPQCLHFLELLQSPRFRDALRRDDAVALIAQQQHAAFFGGIASTEAAGE